MRQSEKDLIKNIRRIQIETTHLSEDLLAGAYKSAFKGQGIEFEEDREYQQGDDVRLIDWNVTLRMNHPYVKVFSEERDITIMLMVDVSASSLFGSGTQSKSEVIAEVAAIIAFSAIKNNDKVGLILFTDTIELYVPPRKGTRHVLRIIRELLAFEPKGQKTDINHALTFLGNITNRSGVCFLISDFLAADYSKKMALIARKHDLITIRVFDPDEADFPDLGLIHLKDLETNLEAFIDSSNKNFRTNYQKETAERIKAHNQLMNKIGAGHIEINTHVSYLDPLRKFFKMRSQLRR